VNRETITAHFPVHGSLLQPLYAGAGNAPVAFYFVFSESIATHFTYILPLAAYNYNIMDNKCTVHKLQ